MHRKLTVKSSRMTEINIFSGRSGKKTFHNIKPNFKYNLLNNINIAESSGTQTALKTVVFKMLCATS